MSGLTTFTLGGGAVLLVGVLESLSPLFPSTTHSFRTLSTLLLSLLTLLSTLLSSPLHDPFPHLAALPTSLLFLLHAVSSSFLPSPILHLLLLAAFSLHSLTLALSPAPETLDSRYFHLLQTPILLCAFASLLAIFRPRSPGPILARGVGLVLYGSWVVQIGFSLFSSVVARGCVAEVEGWGRWRVVCRRHEDFHRAMAIANLQFNCHLAGLVVGGLGVYAAVLGKKEGEVGYEKYRPLRELGQGEGRFTLVSSEDEDEEGGRSKGASEITVEGRNGNGNAR